jgi:hypothetical protein
MPIDRIICWDQDIRNATIWGKLVNITSIIGCRRLQTLADETIAIS